MGIIPCFEKRSKDPNFLSQKKIKYNTPLTQKLTTENILSFIENSPFDLLLYNPYTSDHDSISNLSAALWEKYLALVRKDTACLEAINKNTIRDGDNVMKFSLQTKGEKPAEGYPLYIGLHGGGGCPSSLNDSQWNHMKIYYYDSINTGIYVATRGITDNWNLHFEEASYRLYDKLVKYLIASKDVDPNRVYLLGFSAGGDGVYQVVPRMPDLFAAANMSAGHSNGVKFHNLYQTPFLIQMGEQDEAYNRHRVAAENYLELTRLHKLRGGGYEREIFLHFGGSHNNWSDRDAAGRENRVICKDKLAEWLENGNRDTMTCNTAAVHWLRKYKRNPYPSRLVWDPSTNCPRDVKNGAVYLNDDEIKEIVVAPRHLFYWLNIGHKPKLSEEFIMEALLDTDSNKVELKSLGSLDYVSVLLNKKMLDLEKEVAIVVDGVSLGSVKVKPDLRVMTRTLLERGDVHYIFTSEIVLVKNGSGKWAILEQGDKEKNE